MTPRGDFSFVTESMDREWLTHDFQVVEKMPGAWEMLRDHDPDQNFLWETQSLFWDILKESMWWGHSGASMAISLRNMERIAKIGWDAYVTSIST